MSDKEKAIFVFELDEFQEPILPLLLEKADYKLITRSKPKSVTLDNSRIVYVDQVVSLEQIKARAKLESKNRCEVLFPYYMQQLMKLPLAEQMPPMFVDKLQQGLVAGIEEVLHYGYLMEALLEHFDIRCVATNLSGLASRQGIIAVAKANGIPSVHLEHGVWISSQVQRPEVADVVALADDFSKAQVDLESGGKVKTIVTGLPIYQAIVTQDDPQLLQEMHAAKLAFGFNPNKPVLLYANTWVEGMYVGSACYIHKLVDAFEQVLRTLVALEKEGIEAELICRPHPSIQPYEDELAYREVAQRVGFKRLHYIIDRKTECMSAADLVICPTTNTSFLLDAFASKKPVVALDTFPEVLNDFPKATTRPLIKVAYSDSELFNAIHSLLTNNALYDEQKQSAFRYVQSVRKFNGEQAKHNICKLIIELADKGLAALEMLEVKLGEQVDRESIRY